MGKDEVANAQGRIEDDVGDTPLDPVVVLASVVKGSLSDLVPLGRKMAKLQDKGRLGH
jgi:hypothetical protein